MSTIQRTVYTDPVEPSPLSLRVPAGIETWIDFTYLDFRGALLSTDLAAQLELTGRSGTPKQIYSVPATDATNGKARAVIPAGDLVDMNGYRLNLYGTVGGQPALLATGKVDVIPSAGPEAVPPDTIDQIPLSLHRSEDCTLTLKLWQDAAKQVPVDLDTLSLSAGISDAQGGSTLVPFTIIQIGPNEVELELFAADIAPLPDSCWWSLVAASATGSRTLAEGPVTVTA